MKATELRIGNKLQGYNEIRTVAELHKDHFTDTNGVSILYRDADGIELTEEWLVKFGFVKEKNRSVPFDTDNEYFYVKDNLILNVYKFDESTGDLKNEIKIEFHFRSYEVACYLSKELKYVHHLQNLYIDLKEEELSL